jgi:hypothetical protein
MPASTLGAMLPGRNSPRRRCSSASATFIRCTARLNRENKKRSLEDSSFVSQGRWYHTSISAQRQTPCYTNAVEFSTKNVQQRRIPYADPAKAPRIPG